eukprot:8407596-Pyramimonas_sp.AAC.1
MVCPAGAESSWFSAKAGGVAMGVSKKWASWSLRHLTSNKEDLPGKREDKKKCTVEQNQTMGVTFKDTVGMQVLLKGAHITIVVGCLYNGIGATGANVEKLRHLASL